MSYYCGGSSRSEQANSKPAQIDAKTALQQDPANAAARLLLGQVMFRQRDLEGAAVEFGKSLASAKDAAVAVLYAQSLLGSGQQDELLDLHAKGFFAFASRDPEVLPCWHGPRRRPVIPSPRSRPLQRQQRLLRTTRRSGWPVQWCWQVIPATWSKRALF